jgi:cysteine synthase
MTIFHSVLEQIGNTPMVHLARLHRGPGRVLAKMEFAQPGGSIERVRMLEGLGATVIRVPQVDGRPGQVMGADIQQAKFCLGGPSL